MILTAQQKQAMIMIEKFIADKDSQVFILKGYAGTGKTTLIRSIADYLSTQSLHIQLMAPTGRAAKILRSKLPNYGASTIHRGIYNFSHLIVEESEGTLKYIFPLKDNHERCIYIIDEASMISSRESKNELFQFGTGVLIKDLLSYARLNFGGKVIFVGDPMQLPPVGDDCSVALDETYFDILEMNVYSYELTDIVRQDKNSCILANATILRELIRKKERNRLVFKKKEHEVMDIGAMEVAKKYCEDPEQSSAIVCFSNQQAADYNTAIRNIIFPETNHVAVGDKLMVVCNSYYYDKCELLNGDIITVVETSNDIISQSAPIWTEKNGRKVKEIITLDFREISFQVEDGNIYKRYIIDTLLQNKRPSLTIDEMKALYINMVMRMRTEKGLTNPKSEEFTKAMWGDPFYNALHVKYGYAFTCHKSQGGEWNTVYVDFSRRTGLDVDSLRWKYTAITRASKMLWCINLPDVTPITSLKITPINKTAKTAVNALSFDNIEDTPFHPSSILPSVKCKYWSVVKNMNGTLYSLDDFVSFREYTIIKKNENKVVIANVEKVNKETALPNFNSGIVVVDDINIQKKLFHYTFGQGKIGGIVFFNDTDLRPEVGQCLKIFYCVTKDRKGEKRPIVLNVEETAEINTSAIKTIQGHLELKYKNGSWDDSPDFAFIGDYYVHHSILCEYNITKDCYVTADVIYAGQGKWKVIKIHQ